MYKWMLIISCICVLYSVSALAQTLDELARQACLDHSVKRPLVGQPLWLPGWEEKCTAVEAKWQAMHQAPEFGLVGPPNQSSQQDIDNHQLSIIDDFLKQ